MQIVHKPHLYAGEAMTPEEANAVCKKTPAYRQLLERYPPSQWDRRHVVTRPHKTGPSHAPEPTHRPCAWNIEFECVKKPEFVTLADRVQVWGQVIGYKSIEPCPFNDGLTYEQRLELALKEAIAECVRLAREV